MLRGPFVTGEAIAEAIVDAGVRNGDVVAAHVSLSGLGYVVGGPETVVRVFGRVVGSDGTLMVPTQTWLNLDPSRGVHDVAEEQWPLLRAELPGFDPGITPSVGWGP